VELEGKTAIVTGASSGFGAATVRKLREAGVRVAGGARRVERIDADVALPHIRDEGHILFTGSIAGRQAYANAAVYVAAKFALRGFVYGLPEDLLGRPIRISTIDPGLAQTEFSLVRFSGDAAKAAEPYRGVTPLSAD